jgi:putative membrane protein
VIRQIPWTLLRGYLMGAADVVPGVSGGTVALVVGIYERLIDSVSAGSSALGHAVRLDWQGTKQWLAKVEWSFIIPLVLGILLAIVTLAGLLEDLLHDHPVQMAGLFTGLIAGSVVISARLVRRWDLARAMVLVAVGLAVFALLGLRGGINEDVVAQATDPELWAFFGAGAIAICAMILPGVSGSFLLVLLGMYTAVLGAVTDRDIGTLAVFLLGAIVGLALFSQLLHWALHHHHDTMMAALIGLMAGSMRVLWPWPGGLDSTELGAPDQFVPATIALAVVASVVVVVIGAYAQRRELQEEAAINAASTD